MKIIHGSLSSLLTEVKEQGKVDGVRVAAMMQSTFEGAGLPRYTSWVIVSAHARRLGKVGGVAARRGATAWRGQRARLPRPREARGAHRREAVRGPWLDRGGGAPDARRDPRRGRGDP